MPKTLRKALLWAIGFGGLTSLLLEPFSMAIAHIPSMLIAFPAFLALYPEWPENKSFLILYVYQFLYYIAWALIISACIGMYRSREDRLRAEREKGNAS